MDLEDQQFPPRVGSWEFADSWQAFSGLQGGIVLGAVAQTAHQVAGEQARPGAAPQVRTVHLHYLARTATSRPFTVHATPWRTGGTSSLHLQVRQAGVTTVVGQVMLGTTPDPQSAPVASELRDSPEVGEALALPSAFVPFTQHLEIRAVGPGRPLAGGVEPRLAAWLRLRDPAAITDPYVGLGLVIDALPPSRYATATQPAVMPTVELGVHLHRPPPAPGDWVRLEQWTDLDDGFGCIDDAVLHDRAGHVLARSRQTRRAPRR